MKTNITQHDTLNACERARENYARTSQDRKREHMQERESASVHFARSTSIQSMRVYLETLCFSFLSKHESARDTRTLNE